MAAVWGDSGLVDDLDKHLGEYCGELQVEDMAAPERPIFLALPLLVLLGVESGHGGGAGGGDAVMMAERQQW